MFLADLARLLDLSRDFFAHLSMFVSGEVSTRTGHITVSEISLNPFLYFPSLSALSLSLEIHIFVANSRHTMCKIRRTTCRYSHDRCKHVSNWYRPVWTGLASSRYRILDVEISSLTSVRDRSSQRSRDNPSKNILSPHKNILASCLSHATSSKKKIKFGRAHVERSVERCHCCEEHKVADFVDRRTNFRDIDILAIATISNRLTHTRNVRCSNSRASL